MPIINAGELRLQETFLSGLRLENIGAHSIPEDAAE
jgi:hypothetical protein